VSESNIYHYPLRRVVGHWTTSEGVLVEQLECGHDYAPGGIRNSGGTERGRRCRQCVPMLGRTCARCRKLLLDNQRGYCSRACRRSRAERSID
jgi:hypothetical protein